jgi:acetolactate synthase I/II/III large subunit
MDPSMTGALQIMRTLAARGVQTMFSVPGAQVDSLFGAAEEVGITVITTRHESAAALAAAGYAQVSGSVGVVITIPGIGALHTVGALTVADACNAPVLMIGIGTPRRFEGRHLGAHHEVADQGGGFRTLCKWAGRGENAGQLAGLVAEAIAQAMTPRRRPAYLEVPADVLDEECAGASYRKEPDPTDGADPASAGVLAEIARRLENARRPALFVGGGAIESAEQIRALAQRLRAPVVMTTNGVGVVPDSSNLAFRALGGRQIWQEADVALAVGTRLFGPLVQWEPVRDPFLIRVDADPLQLHRPSSPDIAVASDSRKFIDRLLSMISSSDPAADWGARTQWLAERAASLLASVEGRSRYVTAMRSVVPADGIFVIDSTQVGYYCIGCLPVEAPRLLLTSGYQGAMGYSLAAAIGAKVAAPDRPVVALTGDGGLQMSLGELATVAQHDIRVLIVLFNNGGYAEVEQTQLRRFGRSLPGSRLVNPDFQMVARAFGIASAVVEEADGLRDRLVEAIERDSSYLIEVRTSALPEMWGLMTAMNSEGVERRDQR